MLEAAVLVVTRHLVQLCCKVTGAKQGGSTRLQRVVQLLWGALRVLQLQVVQVCVQHTPKLMAPVETVDAVLLVAAGFLVALAAALEVRELPILAVVAEVAVALLALLPALLALLAVTSKRGLQPLWLHTHTPWVLGVLVHQTHTTAGQVVLASLSSQPSSKDTTCNDMQLSRTAWF